MQSRNAIGIVRVVHTISRPRAVCGISAACLFTAVLSAATSSQPSRLSRVVADSTTSASLIGIVVDSVHNRPLDGALVTISGSSQHATSSADGRFRIDSLKGGIHDISVVHPYSDSIGVAIGAKGVTLRAGHEERAAFAIPSPRGMRRLLCGEDGATGKQTMLVGRVAHVGSDSPATDATVELDWLEVGFRLGAGIVNTPRHLEAKTNTQGRYVFCNLADSLDATIRAKASSDSSGQITVSLGDKAIGIQYLFLPPSRTAALIRDSSTIDMGTVRGKVRNASGLPLEGATVDVIRGRVSITTQADGEFHLTHAPMGSQLLRVRRIGYQESLQPIVVTSGDEKQFVVELVKPVAALDPVVIRARLSDAAVRSGFEKRALTGPGRYITSDQLKHIRCVFDAIHITGVTLRSGSSTCSARVQVRDRGFATLPHSIAEVGTGLNECVDLYVDDIPEPRDYEDDSWRLEWLNPKSVVGIEIYTRGTAPMRFPHRLGCSLVLVWTSSYYGRRS